MERTIVVGDIHGCREELEDVVKLANFRPGVRLVLAGDLVAKGPDSEGVIARAREWGAQAVLGNHDAHVLRLHRVKGLPDDGREVKPEHQLVVNHLRHEDWDYLMNLPYFIRLGAEQAGGPDTAVVHAGAVPGIPLEKQDPEHLITLRSIKDNGEPTKKLKGRPWASLWTGPERLIFGHDAIRGLQEYPMATGLDTGCVYGGRLTAIILPERQIVSVPARRAYVPLA
ncbi:MAG TPA: metallophosphoesterase [Polyangia bacterium]